MEMNINKQVEMGTVNFLTFKFIQPAKVNTRRQKKTKFFMRHSVNETVMSAVYTPQYRYLL